MTNTSAQAKQPKRVEAGPDALFTEVEASREQMAATIDALLDRVHPRSASARAKQQVVDYFVTPDGEPRKDSLVRVGIATGCVLGGAAVFWLLRRRFHR